MSRYCHHHQIRDAALGVLGGLFSIFYLGYLAVYYWHVVVPLALALALMLGVFMYRRKLAQRVQ